MHTVIVLLVAAVAVCAISRPPGPTRAPVLTQVVGPHRVRVPPPSKEFLKEYLMPRFLLPRYLGAEESPHIPQPPPELVENDWLNKEIDRINQMEEDSSSYEAELPRWMGQDPYTDRIFENSREHELPSYFPDYLRYKTGNFQPLPPLLSSVVGLSDRPNKQQGQKRRLVQPIKGTEEKDTFALTPLDKGYYETEEKSDTLNNSISQNGLQENDVLKSMMVLEPPRQIRQNPNLSKAKTLVAENLDRLRTGLSHEESDTTNKPHHIHVLETTSADPADSLYGIALIAAIGAAFTMAILGFAFGWYTLSKKAKAAADVDYPAYGVTGPTMDSSGDRKLAHSAHMYHYQHQKQQIIAMERNGLEQRNGSVSDPESEEENEEGDYTVYECPGFATTGDMEVKNPLFSEDPTPATPGKCEVVKPQPKE